MKIYTVKIDESGTKRWYLNDKLHRTDGPAVEYSEGSKFWYLNGKIHRTDGPAVEYANGSKLWYLNHVEYTKADWRKQLKADGVKYKLVKI